MRNGFMRRDAILSITRVRQPVALSVSAEGFHQGTPCSCFWGAAQSLLPPPAPDRSILETLLDGASARSDLDRIHALIGPACVGLPQLIREYNVSFSRESDACLEDPDDTLEIPCCNL
jgi:hypothetical protein